MDRVDVTPTGQTGNNTHAGVRIDPEPRGLAFQFVVEAVGATPTVTWKIQGSLDEDTVSDANAAWYDVSYVTDASDTPAVATIASTAVGKKAIFLSNAQSRRYRRFRAVTSANTNVTYRVQAHLY